ncbi:MAG TPA: hypothetical protein VHT91_23290 [Kofleriaceae bacterium]|nr:hypothetical protein [Kofleriaceae bacterium]
MFAALALAIAAVLPAVAPIPGGPGIVHAQPAEPPGAAEGNRGPGPAGVPAPSDGGAVSGGARPAIVEARSGIDEAKLRELVDREVARILTERAAKDAAERATREAAERDAATSEDTGEVRGASGFMDTRLAFTLTNENILVKPGETVPSVPGWRFGTPGSLGVLFFDGYDTRYSGFETLSHAVMYREYRSGHLQAEGALVVRIDDLSETGLGLSDDGSYVTVSDWKDPSHKDPTRLSLTAFPVSSDRFRLGYSYRLSWGGSPEYTRSASMIPSSAPSSAASAAPASVPGIKLQLDTPRTYAFLGAKSATLIDPRTGQAQSALAVLGGAGFDPVPMLRLEANGGYFDRGQNELSGFQGKKVRLFGGSAQASIHSGMPLRSSIDYQLYKFHGEAVSDLFAPERYPGGLAWLAQTEFTVLGQTLADLGAPGRTTTQVGKAGDLNVRVKLDRLRLRLDLSYRDLAFLLHTLPSLPIDQQFPASYTATSDFFGAIGLDRNWDDWLTLGLIAGVDKPATLTSPGGIPGVAPDMMGPMTAVVRSNNVDTQIIVLSPGASADRQYALKATARVDFARIFSMLVELFASYDRSGERVAAPCGSAQPCALSYVPGSAQQLGLNATLQARF